MRIGKVIAIYIAPKNGDPLVAIDQAQAIAGKGLEGDRYYGDRGTYLKRPGVMDCKEVTLIEMEALEGLQRDCDIALKPCESRRNIITQGISLNDLVGEEFTVGSVRMKGIRLCEPCGHLEKMTTPGVLKGLVHRGGLRAQVLQSGAIKVGAVIEQQTVAAPTS